MQTPEIVARIDELTKELYRFCGPIFVAPSLNSYPGEMIANGTYSLVDTGKRRLLITCYHVWEEFEAQYDKNKDVVLAVNLGDGDSTITFKNPMQHRLASDRDLDLVVLEFEPADIRVPHTKSWFKISDWPISEVSKGQRIVTLGFPGAWRRTAGIECKFSFAALPFTVTCTSDRTIAAFRMNNDNQILDELKDSLGGISGSPTYRLTGNGELSLIGFAKSGSPARTDQTTTEERLSGVLFTHAKFLRPDGGLGL